MMAQKPGKVCLGDLIFVVWSGFISKSMHTRFQLCAAVRICTTLVNLHTNRQYLPDK